MAMPTGEPSNEFGPVAPPPEASSGIETSQQREIAAWEQRLAELADRKREIDELVKRRTQVEADEAAFMAMIKTRFAPALLPIGEGTYPSHAASIIHSVAGRTAIIKPSRRQDITWATYWTDVKSEVFFFNAKNEPRLLRQFDDYLILMERNEWQGNELHEHGPWLAECLAEIDAVRAKESSYLESKNE